MTTHEPLRAMNAKGKKPRPQFTAALKVQVLRDARPAGTPVCQVCATPPVGADQISPTLACQWERAAGRAAPTALNNQPRGRKRLRPGKDSLLTEINRRREVVVEPSAENLQL